MNKDGGGNWNRAARKSGGHAPIQIPLGAGKDKGTVYFEYEDNGPDGYGKRFFSMDWWCQTQGRWRGQVFRADPKPYIEDAKRRGLNVEER